MDSPLRDMESEEIKTVQDLHLALSFIRDADDCPEKIVEAIDEARYSEFFEKHLPHFFDVSQ